MSGKEHLDIDIITGLQGNYAYRTKIERITRGNESFSIMIFGIDNFKNINDLYSYSFGNKVLEQFAALIKKELDSSISLYRIDGDGFGLIYFGREKNMLENQYKKIQEIAKKPKKLDGLIVSMSISAGICTYPDDGESCDMLYRNARLALAEAKKGTKQCLVYYSDNISVQATLDMNLSDKLKKSVENNFEGFHLVYQPIMKSASKEIDGCEVLLRWENESFPVEVSPYIFVPVLEKSGLILEVGRWIVIEGLKQCSKWHKIMPDFKMNINVSARQFEEESFLDFIVDSISEYNINAETITLELTETSQVAFEATYGAFEFLRKQGIKTAFDDFGTGYSSLDMFRSISTDKLKIDRSFIERITHNVTDQILLKSIIDMCQSMNIAVCVEGIENEEIENIVSQMNPQLLQGYLYSRPITAEKFEEKYLQKQIPKEPKLESDLKYAELRPANPMTCAEIINNAHAGVFQVGMDEAFTFLTCNEGYRRILGYTMREMEEKFSNKALGFVHPDDAKWVNADIRNQLGQGDVVLIEFRVVRSDGRAIWITGTGNVVRSTGGNPSLIVVIIENDKKISDNFLLEKECSMFRKIIKELPVGVKCLRDDECFTIEYLSPAYLSIIGFTKKEIYEQFDNKYINIIYEEDRKRVVESIAVQKQKGDTVTVRYRACCKNNNLIWVEIFSHYSPSGEGKVGCWYSSIIEITEDVERKSYRPLDSQTRFHLLTQGWGDVMFEYNCKTEKVMFSKSVETVLGYRLPINNILGFDMVYKEDLGVLYDSIEKVRLGELIEPIEIRIIKSNQKVIWCRVFVNPNKFLEENCQSVIGKIVNIDEEYKEKKLLEIQLEVDLLTGLLNKKAFDLIVSKIMYEKRDMKFALWLFDVDNFNQINDTYGYFIGDKIIQVVAQRIKSKFKKVDVIGRAGGDEYLVFMQYSGDNEILKQKGDKILELLQENITIDKNIVISITLSIGISTYPRNGSSFSELLKEADNAVYRVKKAGKNNYYLMN